MSKAPEDEYVRITVDLPKRSIKRLDQMKDFAGFASRGRTIQAMVSAVADIGAHSEEIRQWATAWQRDINKPQQAPSGEQLGSLVGFLVKYDIWANNVIQKLSRFVKIQ